MPDIGGQALIECVARDAWWDVIPSALSDADRSRIVHRLHDPDDRLDLVALWQVATQVLGRALGWDWWAAVRIARKLRAQWISFDIWCMRVGLDPRTLAADRMLNAGLLYLMETAEGKMGGELLRAELFTPPVLPASMRHRVPLWSEEEESELFAAALSNLQPVDDERDEHQTDGSAEFVF